MLSQQENETKSYRRVGEERDRVSNQFVSIHESVRWHVAVNSFFTRNSSGLLSVLHLFHHVAASVPRSVFQNCCSQALQLKRFVFSLEAASERTTHTSQRPSHSLHALGLPHAPLFLCQFCRDQTSPGVRDNIQLTRTETQGRRKVQTRGYADGAKYTRSKPHVNIGTIGMSVEFSVMGSS